jgi:hypothetical protein
MLQLLADENFSGDVIRGLLRIRPDIDLVRVQDAGLRSADDAAVLEWAALNNRIVVSHDRATLPDFAYARLVGGLAMPGVFIFNTSMPIRQIIDELLVVHDESTPEDWVGIVLYFPL